MYRSLNCSKLGVAALDVSLPIEEDVINTASCFPASPRVPGFITIPDPVIFARIPGTSYYE